MLPYGSYSAERDYGGSADAVEGVSTARRQSKTTKNTYHRHESGGGGVEELQDDGELEGRVRGQKGEERRGVSVPRPAPAPLMPVSTPF